MGQANTAAIRMAGVVLRPLVNDVWTVANDILAAWDDRGKDDAMTTVFQPAYTIRYKESEDSVVVQSHSMDGRAHDAPPKSMRHENLPMLFFQLIDQGYEIMPGKHNDREHFREVLAFSPEFAAAVRLRNIWEAEGK